MRLWVRVTCLLVMLVVIVSLCCEAQRTGSRPAARRNQRRPGNRGRQASRGNRRRPSASTSRGRNRSRHRVHPSCEEIYLPMCKDLVPYTHTKLPNKFGHTSQDQVYRVLEHLWAHMDHSCSRNTRLTLCASHLPKCRGRRTPVGPCKRSCMNARRQCSRPFNETMGMIWDDGPLACGSLANRRCLRPVPERRCRHEHPTCVRNQAISVCANLTFTWGTLPNMFQQCDTQEINTEVRYFDALRATNCHQDLNFFLCGVYSPFCIRSERPFTFPCRELCDQIRSSCESHYRRLYHNLPWPNKLQCHRYPSTTTPGFDCVMPREGGNFMAT